MRKRLLIAAVAATMSVAATADISITGDAYVSFGSQKVAKVGDSNANKDDQRVRIKIVGSAGDTKVVAVLESGSATHVDQIREEHGSDTSAANAALNVDTDSLHMENLYITTKVGSVDIKAGDYWGTIGLGARSKEAGKKNALSVSTDLGGWKLGVFTHNGSVDAGTAAAAADIAIANSDASNMAVFKTAAHLWEAESHPENQEALDVASAVAVAAVKTALADEYSANAAIANAANAAKADGSGSLNINASGKIGPVTVGLVHNPDDFTDVTAQATFGGVSIALENWDDTTNRNNDSTLIHVSGKVSNFKWEIAQIKNNKATTVYFKQGHDINDNLVSVVDPETGELLSSVALGDTMVAHANAADAVAAAAADAADAAVAVAAAAAADIAAADAAADVITAAAAVITTADAVITTAAAVIAADDAVIAADDAVIDADNAVITTADAVIVADAAVITTADAVIANPGDVTAATTADDAVDAAAFAAAAAVDAVDAAVITTAAATAAVNNAIAAADAVIVADAAVITTADAVIDADAAVIDAAAAVIDADDAAAAATTAAATTADAAATAVAADADVVDAVDVVAGLVDNHGVLVVDANGNPIIAQIIKNAYSTGKLAPLGSMLIGTNARGSTATAVFDVSDFTEILGVAVSTVMAGNTIKVIYTENTVGINGVDDKVTGTELIISRPLGNATLTANIGKLSKVSAATKWALGGIKGNDVNMGLRLDVKF